MALFALWPFTRLVHAFSAPIGYLFRPYIVYRSRGAARPGAPIGSGRAGGAGDGRCSYCRSRNSMGGHPVHRTADRPARRLTPGQVVGSVSGFVILALAAVAVLWSVRRSVPQGIAGGVRCVAGHI